MRPNAVEVEKAGIVDAPSSHIAAKSRRQTYPVPTVRQPPDGVGILPAWWDGMVIGPRQAEEATNAE